jgi:trans-aconitate 2-methyltransferase
MCCDTSTDVSASTWDPTQYLRFGGERLRPALDLLAQVKIERPRFVVDLGCGAGNVTAILKQHFPAAEVLGIDGSPAMLQKARAAAADCGFLETDIGAWQPERPPDLIFSNATLHWLANHTVLFPRLVSLLAPGGVLAVQMPAMHDAPFRRLQSLVASDGPWAEALRGVGSAPDILPAIAYWDLLRPHTGRLDMWETTYFHALRGNDAVLEWASGSSLRPFLDALSSDLRDAFRQAYAETIRPHYPPRPDGSTLLPFRRLFMIAMRD